MFFFRSFQAKKSLRRLPSNFSLSLSLSPEVRLWCWTTEQMWITWPLAASVATKWSAAEKASFGTYVQQTWTTLYAQALTGSLATSVDMMRWSHAYRIRRPN